MLVEAVPDDETTFVGPDGGGTDDRLYVHLLLDGELLGIGGITRRGIVERVM